MSFGRWRVRLKFEPRDVWVGFFWKVWESRSYQDSIFFSSLFARREFRLYVCLLPTLPIVVSRRLRNNLEKWMDSPSYPSATEHRILRS